MVNLPNGVDINNLIEDLKIYSWQAADILLNYSKIINDPKGKDEVLKSVDLNNPVTEADLQVNEIIIKNIKKKYSDIDWKILSEENVKTDLISQLFILYVCGGMKMRLPNGNPNEDETSQWESQCIWQICTPTLLTILTSICTDTIFYQHKCIKYQ